MNGTANSSVGTHHRWTCPVSCKQQMLEIERRPVYEAKVHLPQFVFYSSDFLSGLVDFFFCSVDFVSGLVDFFLDFVSCSVDFTCSVG